MITLFALSILYVMCTMKVSRQQQPAVRSDLTTHRSPSVESPFPGANLDYIVVGSDSGKIIILQYDKATNKFVKVHEETFGKTGCRR